MLRSLAFLFLTTSLIYAEGDDESIQIEADVVDEPEATDDTVSEPLSKNDELNELRARLATLEGELTDLKSNLPAVKEEKVILGVQPSTSSATQHAAPAATLPSAPAVSSAGTTPSAPEIDDDVKDLLKDMEIDLSQAKEKIGAEKNEEVIPMIKAHQSAQTMEVSKTQSDFDKLEGLYQKAKGGKNKQACESFKLAASQFIQTHQSHSLSRSAMYYNAKILLDMNDLKGAQNAFARVYKGDEEGPHAADSLLGMAQIFLKEGKKEAALKFIEKVAKDFNVENVSKETQSTFKDVATASGSKITLGHKKGEPKPKAPAATPQKTTPQKDSPKK